jgi:PTH1 family peptidyl-tRNA hydrolase
MPFRALIAGLGNPGPSYAGNRHNFGFMAARALLQAGSSRKIGGKGSGELWDLELPSVQGRFLVLMPQTFMNLSGQAVAWALGYYKLTPDRLLVVHDELDLPLGRLRLKSGGGTAGHNGLKSIVAHAGTPDFIRLRLGIGRPLGPMDVADYVLQDFSRQESPVKDLVLTESVGVVRTFFTLGPDQAMHQAGGFRADLPDQA